MVQCRLPLSCTLHESIPLHHPRCLNMVFGIRIPKISLPVPLVTSYSTNGLPLLGHFSTQKTVTLKRGQKRTRKKSQPTVHLKFAGRGARDLFHEELGFIRCWMELHPEESQRDVLEGNALFAYCFCEFRKP